jgi:predicted secreted hydrolase
MRWWLKAVIAVGIVALSAGILALMLRREEPQVQSRLLVPAEQVSGFSRADGPAPIEFPVAHGPHPDYQTEWWYYTGNLQTADGRRFGYQLTFFRRALVPPSLRTERPSAWAADQIYMAHLALTDVAGKRHAAYERFARGAAGLAGAQAVPHRVWLEDWSVELMESGAVWLRAGQDSIALDLLLTDRKGPTLQGDGGYSPKGPDPGNASYYYSLTRLETSGSVRLGDTVYAVSGHSWMDHEWSTSALAADQVGWGWFSIQLDDGSELMVFQLRKADGSIDPFSSGTFIDSEGSATALKRDQFEIRVDGTWRSSRSGATYPARWTVSVPSEGLTLSIEPYLDAQELILSFTYWEGAVRVVGRRGELGVSGSGYVEMTGYAESMQGQF